MIKEKTTFETEPKRKSESKFLGRIKSEIVKLKSQARPDEFNERYDELRENLIKENPEEALTIEVIFGIKDLVRAGDLLDSLRQEKRRIWPERFKAVMRDLTEWEFTATHLLIHAGQNKKFAETFWSECATLYTLFSDRKISPIKKGIIGQVGVYRLIEHFGLAPKLSHPDEDAFEKTDLWVSYPGGKSSPFQTKYTARVQKPILFSTPEITYPSIQHYEKEKDVYISNTDVEEMIHLKERCETKSGRVGKKVVGFYLACPEGSFDGLTGQPTKEFLDKIKPEIKKYFGNEKQERNN